MMKRILLACLAFAVSGCLVSSKTTKAPAGQADALQDVQGYLVQIGDAKGSILGGRPQSGTRIVATSLPARMEKTIHTLQRGSITHNLSGPDESGRVVYLEDYFFVPDAEKRHLLKCVSLKDDKETTIFTKPGSAMWATSAVQTRDGHGVIGTYLALAPRGGNVALLSKINSRQMPGALLNEGRLEIWNLDKKKKVEIAEIKALNQPMAWFPDGNQLAYVKLTPIKQIPEKGSGSELLGSYAKRDWEDVPAIFLLDLKTGKSAFLAVGWQPAISPDGKTLIVTGAKKLYSVDLATGKATDLNLPKVAYRTWDPAPVVVGIAVDGTVFHRGLPLTGKRAKTTSGNSPLVGRKPMLTVRAANPATGKSVVVIPYFDPRHRISFGIPAREEKK
jgi:hypothetical protein